MTLVIFLIFYCYYAYIYSEVCILVSVRYAFYYQSIMGK